MAGLKRFDDGVPGGAEMFPSMLVLRRIAAAHVPTDPAETQFDPHVARCQAILAALGAR